MSKAANRRTNSSRSATTARGNIPDREIKYGMAHAAQCPEDGSPSGHLDGLVFRVNGGRIGQYSHLKQYIVHALLLIKVKPQEHHVGDGQAGRNAANENDEALSHSQRMEPVMAAYAKERMIIVHVLEPVATPAVSWKVICAFGQPRHNSFLLLGLLMLALLRAGADGPHLFPWACRHSLIARVLIARHGFSNKRCGVTVHLSNQTDLEHSAANLSPRKRKR